MNPDPWKLRIAGITGFLAVALGAFGAHALHAKLEQMPNGLEIWRTATLYHLVHAVVLLVLAYAPNRQGAGWFRFGSFVGGIVVFSGSLYLLAVTQIRWLGAITPVGGALFLIGWCCLVIGAKRA